MFWPLIWVIIAQIYPCARAHQAGQSSGALRRRMLDRNSRVRDVSAILVYLPKVVLLS